jgi:hypothetical protein
MVPKKFQSFILPQHKRGFSIKGVNETTRITPKKHGRIALHLRRHLRGDNALLVENSANSVATVKTVAFLDTLSDAQPWHEELHGEEYATFLCMAYAIALDEGI